MDKSRLEKGLEQNKAFQEYKAMSREDKDKLKKSAFEQKDFSQTENKDEQLFALQDVVRSNMEVMADFQRQLVGAKTVFQSVSKLILNFHAEYTAEEGEDSKYTPREQFDAMATLIRDIMAALIVFGGATPVPEDDSETKPN